MNASETALDTHKTETALDTHKTETALDTHKTETALDTHKTETALDTHKTETALDTHKTETALDTHKTENALDTHKTETALDTHKTAPKRDYTKRLHIGVWRADSRRCIHTSITGFHLRGERKGSSPPQTIEHMWGNSKTSKLWSSLNLFLSRHRARGSAGFLCH